MKICLNKNAMFINRSTITYLGEPTHLQFLHNEAEAMLYVLPSTSEMLDAFEIPRHYWKSKRHSCPIHRIAFIKALKHRMNWYDKNKYSVQGVYAKNGESNMIVFALNNAVKT